MFLRDKLKSIDIMSLTVGLLSILSGGFYEWSAAVAGVILAVLLIVKIIKSGGFTLRINAVSVAIAVLVVFYCLSGLWAVDRGMAFLGFIKFLPLLLMGLILMQGMSLKLDFLPHLAAAITILSTLLAQLPFSEKYFLVSGRLAGTFQYPNTFALFLIIAELLLVYDFKPKWYNFLTLAILLFGIFYTGSRTGFLIAAAFNLCVIFRIKEKPLRWRLLGGIAIAVLIVGVVGLALGGTDTFARFLTISFKESTFLGRFLYFKDAFSLILKHPLGLGYMGYYYLQPTVQTGVYSVMYAHNDFLQIALDVGWIPALLFVYGVAKSLLSKSLPLINKWLIGAILLHSCFDFNLQFCSIWLILLCLLDWNSGREINLTKGKVWGIIFFAVLGMLSLYFGAVTLFTTLGNYESAHSLFPTYTYNNVCRMNYAEGLEKSAEIAEGILEDNKYVLSAYDTLSLAAYGEGDIEEVMNLKNQLLSLYPLGYDEYVEYSEMLIMSAETYRKSGDTLSAEYCDKELLYVRDLLQENGKKVSGLGRMIVDKFYLQLPNEILEYIDTIELSEKLR